jgi:hypothetical protein
MLISLMITGPVMSYNSFVPVLGYWITTGEYKMALAGLAVASASDW